MKLKGKGYRAWVSVCERTESENELYRINLNSYCKAVSRMVTSDDPANPEETLHAKLAKMKIRGDNKTGLT